MSDLKERILAAIPIESYIGRFVKLKKSGKGYVGLCPFHGEKSPSFNVRPDTGRYHCFGCGKDGDLFTFVMEREGLTFIQAMDDLARYAGIERAAHTREDPLKKYYDLNEQVLRLYRSHLKTDDRMLAYMNSRSITPEIADAFELGSSPEAWQFVVPGLDQNGIRGREDLLKEMGILRVKEDDREGRPYDFFRGRLMFPIRDASGRLCGFGGRALPGQDDRAKYVNSQDSKVFHKHETLYGLFQSLREIRSSREAILVEGYLDVLGLARAGLGRAVAPLGTAFTENQLKLIEKYADTIVCMMDGDKAGRAAALKASRLLLEKGKLRGRVLLLPEGMDAFDLSNRTDPATILAMLGMSISVERYLIVETMFPGQATIPVAGAGAEGLLKFAEGVRTEYERKRTDAEADLKRDGLKRLEDLTRELPAPLNQILAQEGASLIGLRTDAPGNRSSVKVVRPAPAARTKVDPIAARERRIVTLFISHSEALSNMRDELQSFEFQDESSEIMYRYMEARALSGNRWTPANVFGEQLPDEVISIFNGLHMNAPEIAADQVEATIRAELDGHRELVLEKQLAALDSRLSGADPILQQALRNDQMVIILELQSLKAKKMGYAAPKTAPVSGEEV
ncbi:MAG: DNA primase [Leptospirales bacterium]|nr:DNA primase [Leptospirales bacterium]